MQMKVNWLTKSINLQLFFSVIIGTDLIIWICQAREVVCKKNY
jgi:hypothetical protein